MRSRTHDRLAALVTSVFVVSTVVVGTGGVVAQEQSQAQGGGQGTRNRSVGAAGLPVDRLSPLPTAVDGGAWQSGHLQGMAIDRAKGHMYFSFTSLLVKTDLNGRPLGSVTGLTGHLGDLDFDARDGRIYGSLEYKAAKAFYIAVFDGDRITRMNMDAQSSGVVSTVHLQEVVKDYTADLNGDGVFDGDTATTPTTGTDAVVSTVSRSAPPSTAGAVSG